MIPTCILKNLFATATVLYYLLELCRRLILITIEQS